MGKKLTQEEAELRISNNFEEKVILASKYISKRDLIKLKCLDCGKEWETTFQHVGYDNITHHCPDCWNRKEADKWEEKNCAFCGKTVKRLKSRIDTNKTGFFYCSRECDNKHKNTQREETGEWTDSKNYRLKAFKNYPHSCACCNWQEDERILEVHHIDENRENNSVNNLKILCPICHRKITSGYYQLVNNELIKSLDDQI